MREQTDRLEPLTSSKVYDGSEIVRRACLLLQSKANAFRSIGNESFADWLEHVVLEIEVGRRLMEEGYGDLLDDGAKSSREMVGLALAVALKVGDKKGEVS